MDYFTVPHENTAAALVAWYRENARELPWRKDVTPYRVWVSEIMLQQTRVEAVKPYYHRFLATFPDVFSLACADDELLHKMWEGLGYYNRVRNMKKCAQRVVAEFDGQFPKEPAVLQTLPGIGSYTAGAVAAIAYGVPAPAVDGNVLRVLARLTDCNADISQTAVRKDAEKTIMQIIPRDAVSAFTQSLFELGAMICLPGSDAKCDRCPVAAYCLAKKNTTSALLPVHSAKPERKKEQKTVFLLREDGMYLLHKRPDKGLLAGLWEFPNVNGHIDEAQAIVQARKWGFDPLRVQSLPTAVHIFTHKEWHMQAFLMDGNFTAALNGVKADVREMKEVYALPSAFAAYRSIACGED
ncbi:MAG: A/G-specific adenine glycosylase [Clostridia bacterium]|nr:A/G-specific adenine glycosylase [Clostridia bacterium]